METMNHQHTELLKCVQERGYGSPELVEDLLKEINELRAENERLRAIAGVD